MKLITLNSIRVLVLPLLALVLVHTQITFGLPLSQCGCPIKITADALADINTALEECCDTTSDDLQEIQLLMADCCQALIADVNLTASLILTSTVMSSCVAANNALTMCCADIASSFQQTWTAIGELGACSVTPVLSAGTIAASGSYCLADNIAGTITVAADNVTIDLNGRTLTGGIVITGSSNTKIYNGIITGGAIGIDISGSTGVILQNLLIADCTSGLDASNVAVLTVADCMVSNAESGISLNTCSACLFNNCIVNQIVSNSAAVFGVVCVSGRDLVFNNCMISNVGGLGAAGILSNMTNRVVLNSCVISQVTVASGGNDAIGIFSVNSDQFYCYNSSILDVSGTGQARGISALNSTALSIRECAVQDISSSGTIISVAGIAVENGTGTTIIDSSVNGLDGVSTNTIAGFALIECTNTILARCSAGAINNGSGFLTPSSNFAQSIALHQCTVVGVTGNTTTSHGFKMDAGIGLLNRCTADTVAGSCFQIGENSDSFTRWTVTKSMASNGLAGFNRILTAAPAPGSIADTSAFCFTAFQNWPFIDVLGDQISCGTSDTGPVIGYNTAS